MPAGTAIAAARAGRRHAEALMIDACEIHAPTTYGPLDPETGTRPAVQGALRYSGKCKVQTYEPFESTPESGQHAWTVQRYSVHIPAAAAEIRVNDEVTITTSVLDEHLVDRRYVVAGLLHKSYATAQRLLVDEVTA